MMGFFDFLRGPDFNRGLESCKNTPGAVLLDVRSRDEYRQGHISGSINIPLDEIAGIAGLIPDKDRPLFVHCLSGVRSGRAVRYLKRQGYSKVTNIGGISRYRGRLEVN